MALEGVAQVPTGVLLQAGKFALSLEALGIITLVLIVSIVINIILNFKRKKKLVSIEKKLINIEKMLSKK